MSELEFYKQRSEEKSEALHKITAICLTASGQGNIFDITQDALDYILVLERKLEECHQNGKGYKDDADVVSASSKYWGHAK